MKSKEYNQINKYIYDIYKEVIKNKKRIESGIQEMLRDQQLIQETKEYVFALRKRLEELQQQNEEYYKCIKDKIKYKEQAEAIYQVANAFHEENKNYGDSYNIQDQDLPREKQVEIGMKIDDFLSQINAEYSYSSEDYLQKNKQLDKANIPLDREIDLLKLLSTKVDQFRYADNFDIILDEFSNKLIPEDKPNFTSFEKLYSNQNFDKDIQIQNSDIDITIPPPLAIDDMKNHIAAVIKDCNQKSKSIKYEYLVQHQELSKMIEALKNRPIDLQDKSSIESCLQHKLQTMRPIGSIRAIQLPSQFTENTLKLNPLMEVFSKFDSFFEEIDKCKENRNCNQLPRLDIPQFQIPNNPKCIRKSSPSEELVKFAEDLNSIVERTKRMIPIVWSKSITETYRSLRDLKRYEYSPPSPTLPTPDPISTKEDINEDIQFDRSSFDRFKETFSRKLPDELSQFLETKRIALEIPDSRTTSVNNNSIENKDTQNHCIDIPSESSKIFLDRIKATNVIFRDLVNQPKIGVPRLQIPEAKEMSHPEINSNSLIEKVKDVLSPKQQSIRYLKSEIERLNAKIEEVTNQAVENNEEEDDDDNSETTKSIEDETSHLNESLDSSKEKYIQYERLVRELSEKRDKIKNENEIIKQLIDENELTDEMVAEIEKEYKDKKENLQQRMDDLNELMELQSQLRANA